MNQQYNKNQQDKVLHMRQQMELLCLILLINNILLYNHLLEFAIQLLNSIFLEYIVLADLYLQGNKIQLDNLLFQH